MGERLGKFEVEKRQAVENEDYDKAKLKKVQMEEYRLQMYKQLDIADLLEMGMVSYMGIWGTLRCGHWCVRPTSGTDGSFN